MIKYFLKSRINFCDVSKSNLIFSIINEFRLYFLPRHRGRNLRWFRIDDIGNQTIRTDANQISLHYDK